MNEVYDAARNIAKIKGARYLEEDRGQYETVECIGALHNFLPDYGWFDEMVAKVCFLCSKDLVIETNSYVSKSKMERNGFGDLPVSPDKGVSTLRMERLLQFNGFKLISRSKVGGSAIRFEASRMPYIEWDGVMDLWEYYPNRVVEVSIDHPSLDNFWHRWDLFSKYEYPVWVKYRARVDHIVNNFKPWLWQPLWYCVKCKRQHQGGHRLHVAKKMGFKTIKYWMMEHFWDTPKQRSRHYFELKKTIKECQEYEAKNNIERTEPFVRSGEVIG